VVEYPAECVPQLDDFRGQGLLVAWLRPGEGEVRQGLEHVPGLSQIPQSPGHAVGFVPGEPLFQPGAVQVLFGLGQQTADLGRKLVQAFGVGPAGCVGVAVRRDHLSHALAQLVHDPDQLGRGQRWEDQGVNRHGADDADGDLKPPVEGDVEGGLGVVQ